jgi:PD-(D/E)XK nuclease superfamily protein
MTRKEEKPELIYKEESYAIIGASMAVYKDKGCGSLERVYHECLQIEFEFQAIPFFSKPPHTLKYRDRTLVQTFSPDFLCYDKIHPRDQSCFCLGGRAPSTSFELSRRDGLQIGFARQLGRYPRIEYERLLPRTHEAADLHI